MAKQKAQFRKVTMLMLPIDVRESLAAAKNRIRIGMPGSGQVFNNQPSVLPNLDKGCEYFEFDVGAAHPDDPLGERGKRRLVIEIVTKPREIREIYFTDGHYTSGTFCRVV